MRHISKINCAIKRSELHRRRCAKRLFRRNKLDILERKRLELRCVQIIIIITAIGLLPGGSGYFICKQNMELVTTKFKSGGLHEKHVVATWNLGNHLSICF